MISKLFRHLSFFAILWFCSVQVGFAQQAPSNIQHHLFSLKFVAGVEQEISTPFTFQAFAVSQAEGVEVRFLQGQQWSEWTDLHREEPELAASELLFVKSASAFEIRSSVDQQLTATILQIHDTPLTVAQNDRLVLDTGVSSSAFFRIVSREEWGADESLGVYYPKPDANDDGDSEERDNVNICAPIEKAYPGQYQVSEKVVAFDSLGRPLLWPRQYSSTIKKIVIHHTAQTLKDLNNDGRMNERDYKLGVQAIYVYHTVSRGWGDIGYHYLVDPEGNVYEGRAGGPEVVAAHVLCQNSNTVGVSVMGNFEENKLSEKAFEGLVNITKHLSDQYQINPMGQSSFRGKILPHIVTHAEVGALTKQYIGQGATECPGDDLKNTMTRLRQVVAQGGIKPAYAYETVSIPKNTTVNPLQNFEVRVRLKNSGAQGWNGLRVYSKADKTPVATVNSFVAAGQEVEFGIPYRADLEGGTKQESLTIEVNSVKIKKAFKLSYKINKPVYKYDLVAFSGAEHSLLVGEARRVRLKLRNTSNFPWLTEGAHALQVREVRYEGDELVIVPSGRQAFLSQTVPVGGEVEVSFELPIQKQVGQLQTEFLPMIGRGKGLKGKSLVVDLPVEMPNFAAEVRPEKRKTIVARGFEQEILFQIVNTSNFDWEAGSVWYQLKGGDKILLAQALNREQSLTIPVVIRAGYEDQEVIVSGAVGIERLPAFLQVKNFRANKLSFSQSLTARGAVKLSAEVVSIDSVVSKIGEQTIKVQLKNTGNVPWYSDGSERMVLSIVDSADFFHKSWQKRKIAGVLESKVVEAGGIGSFTMVVNVRSLPKRTTYDEFVAMVGTKVVKTKGKIKVGIVVEGTREKRESGSSKLEASESQDSDTPEIQLPASSFQVPPMRVWLSDVDQDELQVTSTGDFIVWDSKSVQVRSFKAGAVFSVPTADVKSGTIFRAKAQGAPALELKNWGLPKQFGTKKYLDNTFRNVLEFQYVDAKMVAINELPLEDYMKGIAEVPETDDQPEEKRKTIAVLARSYALHYLISGYEKFPGKPYNAANSPAIFQKYLGYGFEQRAPKWQKAVSDTTGEVVLVSSEFQVPSSKAGTVLRAAYFSCTDGKRTKSWDEVWGDNEYFQKYGEVFQSVVDPLGDDPTRAGLTACGHQVGLSGYGATQMAKNGKKYRDIIGFYYQGIEVGTYEE